MARTPPGAETGAQVDGLPPLILHDEDREAVSSAVADLLVARVLADEARTRGRDD